MWLVACPYGSSTWTCRPSLAAAHLHLLHDSCGLGESPCANASDTAAATEGGWKPRKAPHRRDTRTEGFPTHVGFRLISRTERGRGRV
jgi:hypothetical protein